MTKVSIVILNWNHADDTLECLKSIKDLLVDNFELTCVVVDNGSKDDSVKRLTQFINKENKVGGNQKISWRLIGTDANRGFAGGNNFGIKYALERKADYVMILNNDTRVHPTLLIRIIEVAKKYSDFGVASPKICFEEGYEFHKERYKKSDLGKVVWYACGEIDWDNLYGKTRGVDEVDKGQYDELEETEFATGTCMFLSRKVLEKVGSFDEKYFMYYEDTDFSQRTKRAGFKVFYVPDAVVWHKVAQSSGIGSNLNDYFIARNRLLFGMRYANFRTRLALYRESMKLLLTGREWQKRGVLDFYFRNFGKGSWRNS